MNEREQRTANMGFAIAGVPCFADSFVVKQSVVILSNSSLWIFNPDFSVKYVSPECKEDDDDYLGTS